MTDYTTLNQSLQTSLDVVASMSGLVSLLGEVTSINRCGDYIYRIRRTHEGVHVQVALKHTPLFAAIEAQEAVLFKTTRLQTRLIYMSELAVALNQELLTASDIAKLLKITPRGVRDFISKCGVASLRRDGIQAWPIEAIPSWYRNQLLDVKKKSGHWTFEDLLRQATPRWEPARKLATLPAYSQEKAFKVRAVMLVYFEVLEQTESEHQSNCAARTQWLQEFAEACNEKTIRRWAAKTEDRGGVQWAPIEAYADGKSVPHENATIEKRKLNSLPDAGRWINAFKVQCTLADMNIAAAHRKFEEDWQNGIEVPGVGVMTAPRQPFPIKLSQMRKFVPSSAARKKGNQGNAAAMRDALPYITCTYENLRACQQYVFDDTRLNVTAIDDLTGKPVELKCYIAMDCASRAIVGYVIRKGNMLATDVDALVAQVLRHAGLAHPDAGYVTTLLFERGTVACSPAKKAYLETLFPGRIRIKTTSMDGGQNYAGDYVQAPSGHWMGKGMIESFNRTLGYYLRHLPGQRGSTWADMPSMVGYPNGAHAGSQVREAADLAAAAIEKAYLESYGTNEAPRADEAIQAAGIKLPLMRVAELRQAFAKSIEFYNSTRKHRREGFRQLPVDRANGGLEYQTESSNERWSWLVYQAEQIGKAPQRLCPADTVLLMHKARKVTVGPNGVSITEEGITRRYWHQDSVACQEANLVTGSKRDYIAIVPPDEKDEIFLLRNATVGWTNHDTALPEGDRFQFLERLPLYEKADVGNSASMSRAFEEKRHVMNRATGELATIHRERMKDVAEVRESNASAFVGVVSTRGGVHETSDMSAVGRAMRLGRAKPAPAKGGNGRDHVATPDAVANLSALLQSTPEAP